MEETIAYLRYIACISETIHPESKVGIVNLFGMNYEQAKQSAGKQSQPKPMKCFMYGCQQGNVLLFVHACEAFNPLPDDIDEYAVPTVLSNREFCHLTCHHTASNHLPPKGEDRLRLRTSAVRH